jgi:hypothetical protein
MTKTKNIIGESVFNSFEKEISQDHFKVKKFNERIELAAELAEEKPLVTMTLRDHGILRTGEHNARILHIYRPNLWAQDYAHSVGKLSDMTVNTAIERANASIDYVLRTSKSIRNILKDTGTTEYDLFIAMREGALIESAYYTRLGGAILSEKVRKKIDVAIMRRALRNESMFQTIVKHAEVEESDGQAMLQFSEEMDLTEILTKLVKLDPYFNRRSTNIDAFSEINSEESVKLQQTRSDKFAEELLSRMAKKHPSLFNKIARMTGFGA